MPIPAASLTVKDGAGTPVDHTFSIVDRTGLASVYRNMAASLVRGSEAFTHEIRLGKSSGAANRALMTMVVPTEGTVNGIITVSRSSLFKAECNFSPDAPEVERTTQYGLFINMLAHVDVKQAVTKLISLG